MPKVSICVPACDNPEGVSRLLTSAAGQTYTDFELIITDDSADDAVWRAVKACADDFAGHGFEKKIRYYRNGTHDGPVANWNKAIREACGDYIHLLHHDDWYAGPDSLRTLVEMLDAHPEADLAFCGTYQVKISEMMKAQNKESRTQTTQSGNRTPETPSDNFLSLRESDWCHARCITPEQEALLGENIRNLFLGNTIGAPSAVLVRAAAMCGNASKDSPAKPYTLQYDEKLTWLVDSEFYMQVLENNPCFICSKEPLIAIGLSDGQLTNKVGSDPDVLRREYGYVYEKHHLSEFSPCRAQMADILVQTGTASDEIPKDWQISSALIRQARRRKCKKTVTRYCDTAEYLYQKWTGRIGRIFGKPASALFWLGLLIEIGIVIIDKSAVTNPYEGQLFRLTFLLFFAKVVTTQYTPKERWRILFFLLLGLLSWRITGRNEIIRVTVFIAAMIHGNVRKIMKVTLWTTLCGCLILVGLSVAGIMGNMYLTQDFGNGMETRWCLGLGHPNALQCMAMMLLMLGLYLYDASVKPYMYAVLFLANGFLYYLTRSNTAFLIGTADIVLSALLHYSKRLREGKAVYFLMEAGFAAGLAFSAVAAVMNPWKHPILQKIDGLLTGRAASLWDTTFHEGTLSTWFWFSSPSNQTFFDLGWVRIIYWYGVIPGVIVLVLVFRFLRAARLRRDTAAWVFLILCCIYTVPEAHLVSEYLARNYIFMLAALYLGNTGDGSLYFHDEKTAINVENKG